VDSAIVRIRPNAQKRSRIENLPSFHAFVRDLYLHRRKNLRGALLPSHRRRFSKQQLDQLLQEQGFDAAGRAEALTVEQHVALWKALAQK
jgi:16S rRNA (adenine1518-N6/adenine1519-N6)-dimethyltransferase